MSSRYVIVAPATRHHAERGAEVAPLNEGGEVGWCGSGVGVGKRCAERGTRTLDGIGYARSSGRESRVSHRSRTEHRNGIAMHVSDIDTDAIKPFLRIYMRSGNRIATAGAADCARGGGVVAPVDQGREIA